MTAALLLPIALLLARAGDALMARLRRNDPWRPNA